MVPVKDFDLFLEVAAEIKKQINSQSVTRNPKLNNIRFSILGDGPLKDKLIQKAKDLKLNGCMEFLPPSHDPMPYYLYLNTSIHEGIPLSILEAMSCGKPVVAPKVGGIPEIISHGVDGYLVEERTPVLFSALCNELANDKMKRDEMGKRGAERITSMFSDMNMALQYYNLYLETNRISV